MSSESTTLDDEPTVSQAEPIRRGPPNRMNDLIYRDWMKFQKSFFRYTSMQSLTEESIYFFTKATWPSGTQSESLVVAVQEFESETIPPPRIVLNAPDCPSVEAIVDFLSEQAAANRRYDFILIDLRSLINTQESLTAFVSRWSDRFFVLLRELLIDKRYCVLLVGPEGPRGSGFPIPWSIALACRGCMRLKDEKVALLEEKGSVFYYLVMQAEDDRRPTRCLLPSNISIATEERSIPAWTMPKPPPRKKNEILHPAKYPETLIEEFITLFTRPGDTVLDPMVGTGSTVIAAIRTHRNGFGIDLSPQFVEISNARIREERPPTLFQELQPKSLAIVVQGDATKLDEIPELRKVKIDYAITSPPYWSMLSNPGSENQEARRRKNLPLVYSQMEGDLGNEQNYDRFLSVLTGAYHRVADVIVDNGYLTIVVKNIKRDHVLYPLAWDLVADLCGPDGRYVYLGTTLWCQDDVGMKPFAVGIHWVSNIVHTYCLHLRKR